MYAKQLNKNYDLHHYTSNSVRYTMLSPTLTN